MGKNTKSNKQLYKKTSQNSAKRPHKIPNNSHNKNKPSEKKGVFKNFLIMACFVLFFLVVVWLILFFSKKGSNSSISKTEDTSNSTSVSVSLSSEAGNSQSESSTRNSENSLQSDVQQVQSDAQQVQSGAQQTGTVKWNTIGPIQQPSDSPLISPDYRMISLPENGRVDISYFNTVTFVGDSITQGFSLYTKNLPAKYCAYKSISPKGIYDGSTWVNQNNETQVPLDAIVETQPSDVYILLGANALVSMTDEAFIDYYKEMLIQMKTRLDPSVNFYIQSITPVRPDSKFDQERINQLNNKLAQLAYNEGVYFINLNEALAGDDGYLREEYSGYDGIHMLAPGYDAWIDYLVTHTAYNTKNPYLEGSPAYTTQ